MCKLSHEKCVCFIFLVIVAFLSCSGFRIDRLAMTDVSKKNSHTSNSLESRSNNLFLDRLVTISTSEINTAASSKQHRYKRTSDTESQLRDLTYYDNRFRSSRHRIRHARKLRFSQAALTESDRNSSNPKAWIDVRIVDTKNEREINRNQLALPNTTSPPTMSDLLGQIQPSDLVLPRPTHAIVNRLQRSPKKKHRQKRKKKKANKHCQKQDLARNAYIADTVMLARAESMSVNRTINSNYSVTFRIIEVFKTKEPRTSETIRLTFIFSKRAQNCEPRHESRLVKANIKKMKEYFLFLKSDGSYSYTVYRTPMLRRKEPRKKGGKRDGDRKRNGNVSHDSQIAIVREVCNATFVLNLVTPQIDFVTATGENRISLTCTVEGFPIPIISWLMNETKIIPDNDKKQIVYKRRSSTLTIDSTEYGNFRCITSIGTESKASREKLNKSDMRQCKKDEEYCLNGGDCYVIQNLGETMCSCLDGYKGRRCEQKSSTYQENIMPCNLPQYKYGHYCADNR